LRDENAKNLLVNDEIKQSLKDYKIKYEAVSAKLVDNKSKMTKAEVGSKVLM
jgi:hypothetical protein